MKDNSVNKNNKEEVFYTYSVNFISAKIGYNFGYPIRAWTNIKDILLSADNVNMLYDSFRVLKIKGVVSIKCVDKSYELCSNSKIVEILK